MLHRSPSGAKRKIRQKRDGEGSRPSPFLSSSSSSTSSYHESSASPSSTENVSNYRSLIDSGDYQSILPDFNSTVPPVPTPRLNVPYSSSMSSLELSSTAIHKPPPPLPPTNAKPMIEVHPMPTDECASLSGSSISSSTDLDSYKAKPLPPTKPAVPAKPKTLLMNHLDRSTSMTSLSSPVQHTTSTFLNNFMPTPSLINLQQSYRNPDLGSQDLAKLENTRQESIQKVNKILINYNEEKNNIDHEMEEIQRTGARILSIIERHDKHLANKVRRHLENSKELLEIETELEMQLKKLNERSKDGTIDKPSAHFEESRLRRRFQEIDLLRKIYLRRENDNEKDMAELLTDDELQQWKRFKKTTFRLLANDVSVDYCIRESKMKLDALHLAPGTNT
ncbi:unnamed protein product [Caenorhabditis bovis]|uniref:ASD2 domain-containing protein n=1 Tax=Caenorhabditis bovis TaxID=2654633 RepID=A0A8S1EY22_9PELO|nr:unnamed protein product [Caenorhabditis bovis]